MKHCPVCDTELRETAKFGVQIDACPRCRGVWLDRGELEKIIGMARDFRTADAEEERHDDRAEHRYRKDDDEYGHHGHQYGHKKKKRGFFEMFENMFD